MFDSSSFNTMFFNTELSRRCTLVRDVWFWMGCVVGSEAMQKVETGVEK